MPRIVNYFFSFILMNWSLPVYLFPQEQSSPEILTEKSEPSRWSIDLKGYLKNIASTLPVESSAAQGDSHRINSDMSRVRLSPEITSPSGIFLFHLDLDNELYFSDSMKTGGFNQLNRPSRYNDLLQPSWEPVYNDIMLYRIKIHRAYVKLLKDDLTITAGRQLIRFGSGRLWNPLDIINPVSPTVIEGPEELPGTDALRIQYYPFNMMELSLVIDQKRSDNRLNRITVRNTNTLGRMKTTVGKAEIAGIGGWIARRGICGIDGSYIVMDGMIRASVMYSNPADGKYFVQSGAGYEYTFKTGISIIAEYFFNSAGIRFNTDISNALLDKKVYGTREQNYYILANQFMTMNRHYCGIAVGYDITALLRGDIFTVWDIEGRGAMTLPCLTYNVIQNLDVSLTLIAGLTGGSGNSDFDLYNKKCAVYGYITWYF